MDSFSAINRVMGTANEIALQAKNGDFDDQLGKLMESIDPYWEDREKTEVDVVRRPAPVSVAIKEDGEPVTDTTRTARTPEGGEDHDVETTIVTSEVLPMGEAPTLEEIE